MSRPDPSRTDVTRYPFTTAIATRWADLDPLGHINNVSMAGLFEEGRGAFNRQVGIHRPHPGIRWLIAAVSLNYLAEAHHPHEVTVASGIGHIGNRSWTILSGAFQNGACVATCDTTLVYTDASGPVAFPEDFRPRLEALRFTA